MTLRDIVDACDPFINSGGFCYHLKNETDGFPIV